MAEETEGKTPKKVNWDKEDPDIVYEGRSITLPGHPAKMPLKEAITALERKLKDEETILDAVEYIDSHPMDGAVAFMKAMKRMYGWASAVPTMTFFGPKPPTLLTVKTGPRREDVVQVLWGAFQIPGVEHVMNTGANMQEGRPHFVIYGKVRKREMHIVKELAEVTREILKSESIYKGKAIRLKVNADGNIDQKSAPDFLPTDYIAPKDLVLNDGEAEQVEVSLWTPIRHTAACVQHRIPLKRGVLLEGPYGCGKTMTANVTSQVCVEHGWTFILLDDVRALKDALMFANRYAPAVIFSEDIDRAVAKRDDTGNDILNTIDGILAKDAKVITVLTTNHVDKLERAMLRPGRLDAVITLRAPDVKSIQRLARIYARNLLATDADLSQAALILQEANAIPAVVREVVERSKLAMIMRGGDELTPNDLVIAAKGMVAHLELMREKPKDETHAERLADGLKHVLLNGEGDRLEKMAEQVKEMHNSLL